MAGKHMYDMGIIGNCSYMAYIDKEADVKWMCWPKFDSSFVFGGLLDQTRAGHFYIRPVSEKFKSRQYYINNTNVLCTEFEYDKGRFRVIDYAPRFYQFERYFKPLMLFRKIELLEGNPEIVVSCKPVGEYGTIEPEPIIGSNHIRYLGLKKSLRLDTNIPLSFVLAERKFVLDETKYIALSWGIPLEGPLESTAESFLRHTVQYWQDWINQSTICNFHAEEVIRSALVLKLHQFQDTGAIIAAGTTSLPEHPGSGRNWDYRYCWLRDTYYVLEAFNNLGNFSELKGYSSYIQNIVINEAGRYAPVYSITLNEKKMREQVLDLQGYRGNTPVRIGNQANEHVQNDIYGEMMISLLPLFIDARFSNKNKKIAIRLTKFILHKIEETIDEPDAGLWEFRNSQQQHCFTFLFHWAGSKAALKVANHYGDTELAQKANKLADQAAENIEKCYNEDLGLYAQAIGSSNSDASLFQLITMGYLPPSSPKTLNHLKNLATELKSNHGLFYRYKHQDDFGDTKGSFLICTFWYIEALAVTGQIDKAVETFEDAMKYANHLGLMSEDVDSKTGSQWGNFPQCYSHVGVVNAAFRIAAKIDKPIFL